MARTACAFGLVLAIAGVAAADPDPAAPADPGAEPRLIPGGSAAPVAPPAPAAKTSHAAYSHKGQFGLSAHFALGLRAIATYNTDVFCGSSDKTTSSGNAPVCSGRAPAELGFEVSYGVTRRIDALLEADFGLEHDFNAVAMSAAIEGPHPVRLAPGARFYFSEGIRSKLFTTAQVVFDFSGYRDIANKDRGNDVGVRNQNGLWFDFTHDYGAYAYLGETATFARWLDVQLEIGLGVQGRFGH